MWRLFLQGRRTRVAVIGALAVLSAAGVAAPVLFRMLQGGSTFPSESATPPDPAQPEAWLARPASPPPGAWERPWGVDVFLILPASAAASATGPGKSAMFAADAPLYIQPLSAAGPVYAPAYRPAPAPMRRVPGAGEIASLETAYGDVLAAFDHYLANENRERAILLVGVRDGGLHAARLARERFASDAARERLAALFLIDAATPADLVSSAGALPLCREALTIQCLAAWRSVEAGRIERAERQFQPVWTAAGLIENAAGSNQPCINPVTWRSDAAMAPRTAHGGAIRATSARLTTEESDDLTLLPEAASARCRRGWLEADLAPGLRRTEVWPRPGRPQRVNLFAADLSRQAAASAQAISLWLDANARKPAPPLPPPRAIADAPIRPPLPPVEPDGPVR